MYSGICTVCSFVKLFYTVLVLCKRLWVVAYKDRHWPLDHFESKSSYFSKLNLLFQPNNSRWLYLTTQQFDHNLLCISQRNHNTTIRDDHNLEVPYNTTITNLRWPQPQPSPNLTTIFAMSQILKWPINEVLVSNWPINDSLTGGAWLLQPLQWKRHDQPISELVPKASRQQ